MTLRWYLSRKLVLMQLSWGNVLVFTEEKYKKNDATSSP
jgi:hypothetical protein